MARKLSAHTRLAAETSAEPRKTGLARIRRLARGVRLCNNDGEMRMRGVIVLIVLLSLVAAAVAMASDGCAGMGSVCGAPCSAPCASTPTSASDPVLEPVASLTPVALVPVRAAALRAPDTPPKSLLSA